MKLRSLPENPAYSCVFEPQNVPLFEESPSKIPPLGIRILPHLESSGLDLDVIDDTSVLGTAPWTLPIPTVRFDLNQFKKETTNPITYQQSYLELISDYPSYHKLFTDGSKTNDGVAAAAVSSRNYKKPYACRLPGDSSIYTAELRAILLALKHVYHSKEKFFLILSDSLSALQAIHNLKYDHPILIKIHELYSQLIQEERGIVFVWVPGHVGIRGNSAADSAAKDARDGDISDELIPFSDLKPRLNTYILNLWQKEWDDYSHNKLYKTFPKLKECVTPLRSNRREETIISRLHIGHSYMTHSFLLKGEEPPVCIPCDELLTIEHMLLFCSDLIDIRERHFTAHTLRTLFRDVPLDCLFGYLKETNIFARL
jgi:ribonuclease HI